MKHFSPWLSENLELLSAELGLDLEFVGKERRVGPYRADIVARSVETGAEAIIENQLTKADPKHIGQLLTYIGARDARIGVWVAPRFLETNLKAIRLLNRLNSFGFSFFAVMVRVLNEGRNSFVPILDVVEHPDGWEDPRAREFWPFCKGRHPEEPKPKKAHGRRRVRTWVEGANLEVVQYFRHDGVRVYLTGKRGEDERDVFARIRPFRPSLLNALGLSAFPSGAINRCRTELKIETRDRSNWAQMSDWLIERSSVYRRILKECSIAKK